VLEQRYGEAVELDVRVPEAARAELKAALRSVATAEDAKT
jgi:hypothetical protein